MSDIDDKLREILLSRTLGQYAADGEGNLVPVNWEDSPLIDQFVREIKQAFAEQYGLGYVDVTRAETDQPEKVQAFRDGRMTSQEWQRRFTDALGKPTYMDDVDGRYAVYKIEWIAEAARRAAGLETEGRG